MQVVGGKRNSANFLPSLGCRSTRHSWLANSKDSLRTPTLDDENILISHGGVNLDLGLAIGKLAEGGDSPLHAQAVADAIDQSRVRRAAEDNGATHDGRPEQREVAIVVQVLGEELGKVGGGINASEALGWLWWWWGDFGHDELFRGRYFGAVWNGRSDVLVARVPLSRSRGV